MIISILRKIPTITFNRSYRSCISLSPHKPKRQLPVVTIAVKMSTFKRLPTATRPRHQEIDLSLNMKDWVFSGRTKIHLKTNEATNTVVLNAIDLDIKKAEFVAPEGGQSSPAEIKLVPEQEIVQFTFPSALPLGNGALNIEFTGEINNKMKGLYRSKYVTETGEEHFAAVTQFEATDARRCFPCFDEPACKSTFDVSVTVPKNLIALSNMPVVSEVAANEGQKTVKFDRTPIMSTYLVALVVGEFDFIEDTSSDGVKVRVYTPKGKAEFGRFALDVAVKVLPYYKDYFQISYPLPKMDLVAISDFSAGAMENWGLVTYREVYVLVDPKNTSLLSKQTIALVVGHEIAHQWFGNLVTMEWWTHLWLNEGYASFVEFLCVDHLFPDFNIWTQFVTDMYTRALEADALKNSHEIEVQVQDPSEIDEIFDEISYNKGASVIRMLHHYLGDADFRKGMHLYLTRFQYKNAETENLWECLEEASKKPVTKVMTKWIKQKGYPLLTVEDEYSNGQRRLKLTQNKYTVNYSDPEAEQQLWMIPIEISTQKSPRTHASVFSERSVEITIDGVAEQDWIKINPGTIGFYRTQYSPALLKNFIPAIKNQELPPLDRLGLVDDLFALVQTGKVSTVDVLRLIEAYRAETNYTVWQAISSGLIKLNTLLSNTGFADKYGAFCAAILRPVAKRLGWTPVAGESHLDALLRPLVHSMLVAFNCRETIEAAKARFEESQASGVPLHADIRATVYKAVLKNADAAGYERMLGLYRSADLHEEKDRISRSLGVIRNADLLRRVIDFAVSDEVRAQDTVFVISAVAMNPLGRPIAWEYFKANWKMFQDRYEGGFLIARLVKNVTENFASEALAQEVETFFKEHTFPGTERTVQQSLETIRINEAWLKRDGAQIEKFLAEF